MARSRSARFRFLATAALLLATGLSNKEIAASLGCAENTVEYHVSALLRRYRVRSRVELVAKSLAAPHRRAPG